MARGEGDTPVEVGRADGDAAVPGHMSSAAFRAAGHGLVDWIADYWERLETLDAGSACAPGDVLGMLPAHPPERGETWEAIAADIERVVMPGLVHWQSPRFFGYFPCNASAPAVLGELLSAGLNVNGMLWATSPAATELEVRVLDWMAELLGLPERFRSDASGGGGEGGASRGVGGGVIQGTASEAALVALCAARHRAREQGARGPLVAYTSAQAHSSVTKAAMIAGVCRGADDREGLRLIPCDDGHRMRADELARAVAADRAAGRVPFFVCATAGTTGTLAVDPVTAIGETARAHGLWLHVDAAMAGCAAVCPEHRDVLAGVELADSVCCNPHKWLLTNFDCDLLWVADRAALTGALSITPEYLRTAATESGRVVDYRDWQVPLGRRFRALKLWFVLRWYGAEGLRAYIRAHLELARRFEAMLAEDRRFELACPRSLSLVCFRLRGGPEADARTRELLARANATRRVVLTHTTLGRPGGLPPMYVARLAVGGTFTEERHVREAWSILRACADEVCSGA